MFVVTIDSLSHLMRNNNDRHSNIQMKHFHFHFMHNENLIFKLFKSGRKVFFVEGQFSKSFSN